MRIIIPSLLLIFQLCAIGYARAVPTRYFCWAPYDMQTLYHATAIVNGHELTPTEFRQRYRRTMRGTDNRAPQHVIDMLEQAEEKHTSDHTTIVFNYRVNGGEIEQWTYPVAVVTKPVIVDKALDESSPSQRGHRSNRPSGAESSSD